MAIGEAPIIAAVRWINDQLWDNPKADRLKLIDEAGRLFNLSPLDAEFLYRHMAKKNQTVDD